MQIVKKIVFEDGIEQDIILEFLEQVPKVYLFDCNEHQVIEILKKIAKEGY